jgi:hypothetical protein
MNPQDAIDLGNEVLFGNGETKKLSHPRIKMFLVPKHPFMDYGLPPDLLISGQLHYPNEVIFEIVPDMSRRSMPSHKPVEEKARGRIGRHLYH